MSPDSVLSTGSPEMNDSSWFSKSAQSSKRQINKYKRIVIMLGVIVSEQICLKDCENPKEGVRNDVADIIDHFGFEGCKQNF